MTFGIYNCENQRISISKSCVNYNRSPNSTPYPHECQHCRNVASLAASDVSSCIKVSPNSITTRDLVNYITGSTGNGTTREVFLSISKRWSVVLTAGRSTNETKKAKKNKKKLWNYITPLSIDWGVICGQCSGSERPTGQSAASGKLVHVQHFKCS